MDRKDTARWDGQKTTRRDIALEPCWGRDRGEGEEASAAGCLLFTETSRAPKQTHPTNATEKQTTTPTAPAPATRSVHNAQNTNPIFSRNFSQNPYSAFKPLTAVAAVAAAVTAYASRL